MNDSKIKSNISIEKTFEANITIRNFMRHINKPVFDTLQKDWVVERIIFFSFSGTTLSDMKANKTIIWKLSSELLIRFMTSMSISTTITRNKYPENLIDPEATQEYNDANRRHNDFLVNNQRHKENTIGNTR